MSKIQFQVHAGPHARRDCPLVAELPVAARERAQAVVLTTEDDRRRGTAPPIAQNMPRSSAASAAGARGHSPG